MLAWGTFQKFIINNFGSAFIGNQSIEHAVLKGSGGSAECISCIGQFWLELAQRSVTFYSYRVESHANVADGPSRKNFLEMEALEAVGVPPHMPSWVLDPWQAAALPFGVLVARSSKSFSSSSSRSVSSSVYLSSSPSCRVYLIADLSLSPIQPARDDDATAATTESVDCLLPIVSFRTHERTNAFGVQQFCTTQYHHIIPSQFHCVE